MDSTYGPNAISEHAEREKRERKNMDEVGRPEKEGSVSDVNFGLGNLNRRILADFTECYRRCAKI